MFDVVRQLELLDRVEPFFAEYTLEYNNWIGPVDAEMLYGMVRFHRPETIIEVGSGMSTSIMAQAVEANGDDPLMIIAIDPEPRLDIAELGVQAIEQRVEQGPVETFDALEAGDILFIDSSHVYEPGNDVDFLYHKVLPYLASGVIVHVHDIFLPKDYPEWWRHRGYNEQSYLEAELKTDEWVVLWASYFMHEHVRARLRQAFPSYGDFDYPGSFWMERR